MPHASGNEAANAYFGIAAAMTQATRPILGYYYYYYQLPPPPLLPTTSLLLLLQLLVASS